jgi:hypothetical protein
MIMYRPGAVPSDAFTVATSNASNFGRGACPAAVPTSTATTIQRIML